MAKQYNLQSFYFTLPNGKEMRIEAWRYEHSRGWGHKARIVWVGDDLIGYEKRITYYNRTWERFTYESVLERLFEDYFNGKKYALTRKVLKAQIDAIAKHESDKCEKWLKSFTKAYNGLSDKQKAALAASDIEVTTSEQADVVKMGITLMAALNA